MKFLPFLFVSLFFFGCSDPAENKAGESSIRIKTEGIEDHEVYVITNSEEGIDTLASGMLTEGQANIPYTIDYPINVFVFIDESVKPVMTFIEENGINIEIDNSGFEPSMSITGSELQEQMEAYYAIEEELVNALKSLRTLQLQSAADPYLAEVIFAKEDSLYRIFKRNALDFCYENSYVGATISRKLFDASDVQLDSIYQNIPMKYSGSPDVKYLKSRIAVLKEVAVGKWSWGGRQEVSHILVDSSLFFRDLNDTKGLRPSDLVGLRRTRSLE